MSDFATPNLPARDFEKTSQFYSALGFDESWRDEGWMILRRGDLTLEFFPYPDLDPLKSSFGCCLRLDDLDSFYASCKEAGLPETHRGQPRLKPPVIEAWGGRVGFLVDLDGRLVRLIQNQVSEAVP
jgi:catechol 2,3-dioxygenase-like lactoylglutathione lyase family enzyme